MNKKFFSFLFVVFYLFFFSCEFVYNNIFSDYDFDGSHLGDVSGKYTMDAFVLSAGGQKIFRLQNVPAGEFWWVIDTNCPNDDVEISVSNDRSFSNVIMTFSTIECKKVINGDDLENSSTYLRVKNLNSTNEYNIILTISWYSKSTVENPPNISHYELFCID